jgi:hypothetical protein
VGNSDVVLGGGVTVSPVPAPVAVVESPGRITLSATEVVGVPILILQCTITPSIGEVFPPGARLVTGIAPIASVVSLPVTESPMFAGLLRLLPKVTTAPAEDGITSKARITAPKIDRRFDPMQAFLLIRRTLVQKTRRTQPISRLQGEGHD